MVLDLVLVEDVEVGERVERTNSGEGMVLRLDWKDSDQGAGGVERWWVVVDMVAVIFGGLKGLDDEGGRVRRRDVSR